MFIIFINNSCAQDYRIYHKEINDAERCFFLENKTDSAYWYYDDAFSKYDFVFAQDCFMAAQIAFYKKNNKYIYYLNKGFKNGLKFDELKLAPVFNPISIDSSNFKKKFNNYPSLRQYYLKTIDKYMLKNIIKMVSQDQIDKCKGDKEYGTILYNNINRIESYIRLVGFPGDRLIGLTQKDILHELGIDSCDYKKRKDGSGKMNDWMDYESICQCGLFIILVHYPCSYQYFSVYWEKLIISGQIHPRDVATIYDNTLRLYDSREFGPSYIRKIVETYSCVYGQPFGGYKLNPFVNWKNINCSNHIIDSMRKQLFINSLEVDSAKKAFGEENGFKTTFGFFDNR